MADPPSPVPAASLVYNKRPGILFGAIYISSVVLFISSVAVAALFPKELGSLFPSFFLRKLFFWKKSPEFERNVLNEP